VKPAAFTYHRPASLQEALSLLKAHGDQAKLLAGGQSMMPMLNLRLSQPAHLIDLNDLSEWGSIQLAQDHLRIGFLARHHEVAKSALVQQHCPLLSFMASTIGHDAIRHRGTLGGSLAHADPAAQLALMAITLDAQLHLAQLDAQRVMPAHAFLQAAMTTALEPHELLLQIDVPCFKPGEVGAYEMFNRRHGDYALAAVALTLHLENNRVRHMRLGISGMNDKPLRLKEIEDRFTDHAPHDVWQNEVAKAVFTSVQPEEDAHVPALYRKHLAQALTLRALNRALSQHRSVAS
jgi:carbon-monoxide dehydrogenase medium subunit